MKCPVDGATLTMTERSGVEIDYCPQCRGVWLDRGELDKLIDRAAPPTPPVALEEPRRPESRREEPRREEYRSEERPREWRGDDDDERYGKRRKKSLLGEIFDF